MKSYFVEIENINEFLTFEQKMYLRFTRRRFILFVVGKTNDFPYRTNRNIRIKYIVVYWRNTFSSGHKLLFITYMSN